jgi:hypothetical protein
MPAHAGIQKPLPCALDSRFRGNDAATIFISFAQRKTNGYGQSAYTSNRLNKRRGFYGMNRENFFFNQLQKSAENASHFN